MQKAKNVWNVFSGVTPKVIECKVLHRFGGDHV
jgi:hypothetical protein